MIRRLLNEIYIVQLRKANKRNIFMKNFNVIYKHGHLVNKETGKRIFLKRGGEFNLLGDDGQFEEKDELFLDEQILDSEQKIYSLKNRYSDKDGFKIFKLYDKGERFYFRVGLSKKTSENKDKEFIFDAVLLEDLYIRTSKINRNKSEKKVRWYLCNCYCESQKCVYGDLQMIEPIRGNSLNNLFSNLVAYYFPMQRSTAVNAFKDFYLAAPIDKIKEDERFDWDYFARDFSYHGNHYRLESIRNKIASNLL